jgi:hypothetical protein
VEEFVWDYAINTSLKTYEDHPAHTCFSIDIREVLIPQVDEKGEIVGNSPLIGTSK